MLAVEITCRPVSPHVYRLVSILVRDISRSALRLRHFRRAACCRPYQQPNNSTRQQYGRPRLILNLQTAYRLKGYHSDSPRQVVVVVYWQIGLLKGMCVRLPSKPAWLLNDWRIGASNRVSSEAYDTLARRLNSKQAYMAGSLTHIWVGGRL